ncbi:MAG: class I SAM-dependent methyltransferase [Candidatus Eiseniibacteriota bacterium]
MARDLFGDRASDYARTRPTYPDRLFDHLAALAPARSLVWDCGSGSGQAARSLVHRFDCVVGTDISEAQLAHGMGGPRLHRIVAAAEQVRLRARTADLVTVSAALHWFDRPRFYAEARRVARSGAVLAAWSYFRCLISPGIDPIIDRYADDVVAACWLPQFDLNRRAYRDLEFPFEQMPWLELEAEAHMRLEELFDFMRTWSASQAWMRERRTDPVERVRVDLERAWGDPTHERLVRFPLHGVIGRVP